MKPVYLIIGVSGCGKSWILRQLADKFHYIPHDRCWSHPNAKPEEGLDPKWGPPGSESTHLKEISMAAKKSNKPVITEVPFAERKFREDLEAQGFDVIPVFVVEDADLISKRYEARERKPLPKAAYSRAKTIINRAKEWRAFYGTSDEVLKHLQDLNVDRMSPAEWRAFNRK